MGVQRKVGTSLDSRRQEKLDEILRREPFLKPATVLAHALDIAYADWMKGGRDLKGVLGEKGLLGETDAA